MSIRESTIEKAVCQWAKENGVLAVKLSASASQRGQPDRVFLHQSKALFVEFKAERKKPRALQGFWIERLTKMGFKSIYVDSISSGISAVRNFISECRDESTLKKGKGSTD